MFALAWSIAVNASVQSINVAARLTLQLRLRRKWKRAKLSMQSATPLVFWQSWNWGKHIFSRDAGDFVLTDLLRAKVMESESNTLQLVQILLASLERQSLPVTAYIRVGLQAYARNACGGIQQCPHWSPLI